MKREGVSLKTVLLLKGDKMKSILRLFILVLCATVLVACQQKAEAPRRAAAPASALASFSKQKAAETDKETADIALENVKPDVGKRKIVKEGELIFETHAFNETKTFLSTSVKEVRGYIAEENQERYDDRIETRAVIRVPAENFDRLVETLSSKAEFVDRKNVKVLDVTEEYVDLEARLKNRRDIEKRYRQLLGQAKNVNDILNIEKQIGEVRGQIESAEGKLKYLNDRIVFSTLTVVYYEKIISATGFLSKFTGGLKSGWKNFALFIVVLANIWPFIALAVVAVVLIKKFKKTWGGKKDN